MYWYTVHIQHVLMNWTFSQRKLWIIYFIFLLWLQMFSPAVQPDWLRNSVDWIWARLFPGCATDDTASREMHFRTSQKRRDAFWHRWQRQRSKDKRVACCQEEIDCHRQWNIKPRDASRHRQLRNPLQHVARQYGIHCHPQWKIKRHQSSHHHCQHRI